jgi:uncharacterized membrane protein YeaQ/YmgE (transglycosylase-associated protein family)
MDPLNLVVWGIIGAVVGLIISIATGNQTTSGFLMDIFAGLVGGVVGGFILRVLNVIGDADLTGTIHMPSVLIAIVGAILVAGVVEVVRRQNTQRR